MRNSLPPSLAPSPSRAVLYAQRIALEYRPLAAFGGDLYLPPPNENEKAVYNVLINLRLLEAETFQWSDRGRRVLLLSETGFNAIFSHHMGEVVRATNRATNRTTLPSTPSRSQHPVDSSWFGIKPFERPHRNNPLAYN